MAICELSGKKRSFGHNVSHAKNRTNRDWLPNVHKKHLVLDGEVRRISVSARAMRSLYKQARMAARAG